MECFRIYVTFEYNGGTFSFGKVFSFEVDGIFNNIGSAVVVVVAAVSLVYAVAFDFVCFAKLLIASKLHRWIQFRRPSCKVDDDISWPFSLL